MTKRIPLSLLLSLFMFSISAQEVSIRKGMKITRSTRFKKSTYQLSSTAKDAYIILIEGRNIVVDFNNAVITGKVPVLDPSAFSGVCILVRNSSNVTIKNAKAKGYKIALQASNVDKLTIDHCDFSYNYRPRLNSTQEKEDISDWMSYHQNEKDEWLRYGAAMYLRNCNQAKVSNCIVTGGQNALMMTLCNSGMIYNNDFSFNSGIGLGMYRCSGNKVLYNRMNFNVRGYSHGVYNRGQDSAGMLVYEQSSYNIFYKNSVTHSGDGFFLWAGQTTMDTGEGGCNDNLLEKNDFSYAPTNGIEVTFSRNAILGNRVFECDHGIWGGYSFGTTIRDNQFRDNRIGVAIEHGQANKIIGNIFSNDKEAIRLWARATQPSDWGYAKKRDTKSRGYQIVQNSFNGNPVVMNISLTSDLNVFGNTESGSTTIFKLDNVTGLDTTENEEIKAELSIDTTSLMYEIKDPIDPFKGAGKFRGRKNIMMTEWGPYDFRYPIIWNTNPTAQSDTMQFELFGPPGVWKIRSAKGVQDFSAMTGSFPATITASKEVSMVVDIDIELEYHGPSFISQLGEKVATGQPYSFRFRKYFHPIFWEVNWFSLDTLSHNPIKTGDLFSMTERKAPVKTEKVMKLDYAWWGGIKDNANNIYPQFITSATGESNFPKGKYEVSVTWDDAVRVYIDEKLVLNEWDPSRYKFDESPNKKVIVELGGDHNFRVEHVELGGFACLSLKIKPVE